MGSFEQMVMKNYCAKIKTELKSVLVVDFVSCL